ncbi:MAG: 2-oxo-4-hydroxy-4-carboxy-5-ureidoimidazoline decarboxylase [Pseudomonadota bacterium]
MDNRQRALVARYGGVYEHSPWVAECAAGVLSADAGIAELAAAMADCVDNAGRERQLALIRAHPDLAGKAGLRDELTAASSDEQKSAGLDQCTPAELERFHTLNAAYKRKFGFPFVMAVRDSNRHAILAAFAERLNNGVEQEIATALEQIHRIARLRLEVIEQQVVHEAGSS